MSRISNPVLPGFHPDPSIVRVGDHYYLATSTFEWWPGVQIHRSRDLGTWELAGYALTRPGQLQMRGNPDSGGVWAPALSYADNRFWLLYSDVKALHGPYKDVCNYLITAPSAEGPWSDPVVLNRSGFDPSLFHDDDGRKWVLNQRWKPSVGRDAFDGIVLQEFSVARQRLVGEPVRIFAGTALGVTEGPHLYRRGGYYYLVTAEGGTEWNHAVTVARSRNLTGPYEVCPDNPILSASGNAGLELQKAGHGSLVESADGHWYMAHLCSRPIGPKRRCVLGRETALQPISWPEGDWPRLSAGGREPVAAFELPAADVSPYLDNFVDEFSQPTLNPHWNTLREPPNDRWLSLGERPGYLRLRGRDSLQSLFDQSLVGFRLLHHRCEISTRIEFQPVSFLQRAGLALYYNTANFYYAYVTAAENGDRTVGVLACENRRYREALAPASVLRSDDPVELSAKLEGERLQFSIQGGGLAGATALGPALDATTLSDDYPSEEGLGIAFTGAFAVLCAQNSSAEDVPADFDCFKYRKL